MVEHVFVLGWLAIARSLFACGLAGWILLVSQSERFRFEAEPADTRIVRIAIWVLFVLGAARLVHGIASLLVLSWARALGLAFAVFDLLNLIFFPVSTTLGLYALVTFRHAETIEFFRGRLAARRARRRSGLDGRNGRV